MQLVLNLEWVKQRRLVFYLHKTVCAAGSHHSQLLAIGTPTFMKLSVQLVSYSTTVDSIDECADLVLPSTNDLPTNDLQANSVSCFIEKQQTHESMVHDNRQEKHDTSIQLFYILK